MAKKNIIIAAKIVKYMVALLNWLLMDFIYVFSAVNFKGNVVGNPLAGL